MTDIISESFQTSWYKNHFNVNNKMVIDKTEFVKLVNILKTQSNQNVVQAKIALIETEYLQKLTEIENLCNNNEEIDKLTKLNSLKILQKELEIIKLLTKYSLQNNQLNYTFFMNALKLLLSLSETLRTRLNQAEIKIESKIYNDDNISRCSYKFCNYKDSCNYNYNKAKNLICYQDHYVHNMVSGDLRVLLDYIEQKYGEIKIVYHNKEILKTINTLSFVINHMENELKAKCMYLTENEIESFHFVKSKQ
jgi:hypothetical protein